MIDINEIFSDSDKRIALWCDSVHDTNDLAVICDSIIESGIDLVSVPPETVQNMWVYLEKSGVKILTRYNFTSNHKNLDTDVADLAKNISDVCKRGADGVQIFMKMAVFEDFCNKIMPVKDDLFFGKDLCIAMDIEDIDINNWNMIFQKLRNTGAHTLVLSLNEDMGVRSDFVGRVYGMLKNWDFDGALHFILHNDYDRMDQVIRLIETEKPELQDRIKFFLEY
jgi:hypothetical protein